ncbi:MAG TPA: phosphoribosylpyrophosphate synthetase [Cryomorphaceae bacterium]|nr:phosphoribosylpyrophosphate synthetase [Owenweeksia sp.]MBF98521.1 phosphoribosylpyrophosphate synthetase [Owenweeksia sp.]HAD97521.1 phosphoribosylpyrophosphate synthetase [Cryomorphaceae bacterium]HBF21195.1 phosphoribosylpyrophosphate synthetase [Cryomorphaceae bacterium]HCQ16604.1 phosphoribosylpyrophosphate synthetase [Cryomorphaceae bacterium]|tara:strand:- start:4800 stop:5102 length:303 start_codon:yes stop_codon:yes gene_type:complete
MDNTYETLSQGIDELTKRGYTLDFNLLSDSIECKSEDLRYKPAEFHIDEFHRFEGMTNPDDMSILYAISTNDGRKGTMVDAYGAYSDPRTTEMVQKMRIH